MAENGSISKVEIYEDDAAKGISNNQYKQKHRRGKRKHRRRTNSNSTEVKEGGDTNVNPLKGTFKCKTTYPLATKELCEASNVEKKKTFDTLGANVAVKELELTKRNESTRSVERKKNRQHKHHRAHRPHRYNKNVQRHKPASTNEFCPTEENSNSKLLILRPNRGPLMNAPRNSTQFIIDDHEDEEKSPSSIPQGIKLDESNDCSDKMIETNSCSEFQPSPDDDTFWADYLERDFQTVYESVHREDVENWDRTKLIEEIKNLEKRHKDLVSQLSRLDPEIYVRRLQSKVVAKQQQNNMLKAKGNLTEDWHTRTELEGEQFSEDTEDEKTAVNNEPCQMEERETPSQSDSMQTENSTNIVSFIPDSTN